MGDNLIKKSAFSKTFSATRQIGKICMVAQKGFEP